MTILWTVLIVLGVLLAAVAAWVGNDFDNPSGLP